MKKIKLNSWIGINKTRSEQVCARCDRKLNPNELGIIIYLNHPTFKVYGWFHFNCLDKDIRPSKCKSVVGAQTLNRDIKKYDKLQMPNTCKCSFCNKSGKMYEFKAFYIHPACIPKMIKKLKKSFEEKGPRIAVEAL